MSNGIGRPCGATRSGNASARRSRVERVQRSTSGVSSARPSGGLLLAVSVSARPVVLAPLALRATGTLNAGRGPRAGRARRRVLRPRLAELLGLAALEAFAGLNGSGLSWVQSCERAHAPCHPGAMPRDTSGGCHVACAVRGHVGCSLRCRRGRPVVLAPFRRCAARDPQRRTRRQSAPRAAEGPTATSCRAQAASHYARIRNAVERAGQRIGAHDLEFAAIALARGLTVVTHNVSEFARVPGLLWEDWESAGP